MDKKSSIHFIPIPTHEDFKNPCGKMHLFYKIGSDDIGKSKADCPFDVTANQIK